MVAKAERVHISEALSYPVFKPDPFLNELLRLLKPQSLPLKDFDALIEKNIPSEEGTIRFATVRSIDITGFIPNLLGVCQTPEETLTRLHTIAHDQLETINGMPSQLREEVFHAMEGKDTTLRAIKTLVHRQDAVMKNFEDIRNTSPLAQCVRQINTEAIKKLYAGISRSGRREPLSIFDNIIKARPDTDGWERLDVLYTGEPRVCFVPSLKDNSVQYAYQYFIFPNLWKTLLAGPTFDAFIKDHPDLKELRGQSVGHIIDAITPEIYKKEKETLYQDPDPRTLGGFMARVGIGGSSVYRDVSHWISSDEQRRKKAMEDDETAKNLHDFFTTHD